MVEPQDTDKNTLKAAPTTAAATTITPTEPPPPASTKTTSTTTATSDLLSSSTPTRNNKGGLVDNDDSQIQQEQEQNKGSIDLGKPSAGKLAELNSSSSDKASSSSSATNNNNNMKVPIATATATATANTTSHNDNATNPIKPQSNHDFPGSNNNNSNTNGNRRVSFASHVGAQHISMVPSSSSADDDTALVLLPMKNAASSCPVTISAAAKAAMRSLTPDTFSDASSITSGDGPWEVIEYDPSDQVHLPFGVVGGGGHDEQEHVGKDHEKNDDDDHHHHGGVDRMSLHATNNDGVFSTTQTTATPTDDDLDDDDDTASGLLLRHPGIITAEAPVAIAANTPAAEALKASASVKVSRVGKAARAVHMQAVRKLVKRATGTTRSGVVKGKPPRLPPHCPPHVLKQAPQQQQSPLPSSSSLKPPPLPRIGGGGGVGGNGDDLSDLIEDDQEYVRDEEEGDGDDDLKSVDDDGNDHDDEDYNYNHSVDHTGDGDINESHAIQQHADRQQQQKLRDDHVDDENANDDDNDEDDEGRVKDHGLEEGEGQDENDQINPDEAAAAERRRLYRQQQQHDHQNTPLPDNVVQGTVEAGKKVLGAVDPHDMLKLLRWRKKRSGSDTSLKTKSYVKGKVIDGEHELYTLSIAVMIGVRTSISKTNTILNSGPEKRWVHPMDFRTTEKYEFRPKGGTGMPAHQLAHTFKFKDYSPVVFAYLRRMSGINEFDFLISVCANPNFIEFISNARSGQFFFYSSDGRYMIKTMTNAESKFLRRILPDYFRHCCKNPNTMITRFFGMYRVKLYHLRRNVKFVIMNSVYYTEKYLQTFYDLKGSSVGRDAKPGQAVLKDNDLRRGLPDEALALSPETRARVRQQVESDCNFLTKMQIMDYSMLVGVHHVPPSMQTWAATVPSAASGGGGGGDDFDNNIATKGFQGSRRRITSDASETMVHNAMDNQNNHADHDHLDAMRSSESVLASHFAPAGAPPPHHSDVDFFYDDGLDDDESSYLQGSNNRQLPGSSGTRMTRTVARDTELKKMATIEKLYWPFHRLYDIHGHRRLEPALCTTCGSKPCDCKADPSLLGFHIAEFTQPLSDRKDGGLEMDTSCLTLPMIYNGPQGDSLMYEGKIFYMGIIDILQEYNSRKMLESHYRLMQTSGKYESSCVAPSFYAERFLSFFDEFTKRATNNRRRRLLGNLKRDDDDEKEKDSGVEMTLEVHSSRSMIEL